MSIRSVKTNSLSKTQRHCIVGYRPNRGDTSTPALQLKGKWLREAGLKPACMLRCRYRKAALC
ncbi:type I toxin-antitoxin system SymE family toxin [Cronobacter dublinensis]|uniref:SymE family type I addiction module toxin n=1 Tax=Cronobacter dublinensis TaxID=413497 RepID=UPI001ED8DE27|nr:SymE family type I addiction module toxin [Cronobacter dublinensis]MDT3665750.1 SymE family type I addiction module toxin [Cronobacter dublinensis]WEP46920.1 type I toxin-antitoxin system SymE family toxin [Cronobacter dublinensis]WEP51183.1 type I toxin-antitoxin system SymE family toxin [Cronobacter dublinensis]WNY84446.1 type I toxin-antitoxin system SymE family toxin [Cronobacter dublinensis]